MNAETEAELLKEFIREITIRIERAVQASAADGEKRHADAMAYLEAHERESQLRHAQVMKKLDEEAAEGRAQRAALFRILDRLDNGGGAATAG